MEKLIIEGIEIEVTRKRIRNLYLRVLMPDGRVHISAPGRVTNERIKSFARSKLPWIINQRERISRLPSSFIPLFADGETHLVEGRELKLFVNETAGIQGVVLEDGRIILNVRPGTTSDYRKRIFNGWMKERLFGEAGRIIEKWEPLMNVKVGRLDIRQMRSKWGSCNTLTGTIRINLELGRHPYRHLEYIVLHEMTHLLERGHNQRFYGYLDHFMPAWRVVRKELRSWGSPGR